MNGWGIVTPLLIYEYWDTMYILYMLLKINKIYNLVALNLCNIYDMHH